MRRVRLDRKGVVEAIRKAAKKLGRAPSWGELRRISGVPESQVRVYFASLADAVTAAGLEPGRAGLKIATEDLLQDFARVAAKLGRPPSRNEYVREGKYSAGAFYARFKSWEKIPTCHGDIKALRPEELKEELHESDKKIAMQWAGAITALPADLAGKRRVTDAVCAMIVRTLLGADADWQAQLGRYLGPGKIEDSTQHSAAGIQPRNGFSHQPNDLKCANGRGEATLAPLNGEVTSGGLLDPERPVMGPPFFNCALTNAPVNELGVVFLFGMLAGELGFQVEALRAGYPDCTARRQVQPGKWQDQPVEIEYESLNFLRHGHDPAKCHVIVCWRHNWPDCPKHIEVIELSKVLQNRMVG